ncbi:hypothetical protein N7510_005735 [Penicillium lagena]|uniref:uncharacterized protein n=1 Tax=Penicillium lagena TaxID=94218 RepID=UPI002541153E|nr:uncharacterized protein N7510_005735 [Penicillium lagena]KAJ5612541.1 hypothetical protein N7510_005735 [Penicillium lagena]
MRIAIASSLLAYAATVAGLSVTSPVKGEKVDLSKPVTIRWQSVSTDPKTFSIYLVNQNVYPNVETLIASDVDTSTGHYTMKAQDGIDKEGYQINFISNENNGILAQSQQFTVSKSKSSGPVSSSSVCFCLFDFHVFSICLLISLEYCYSSLDCYFFDACFYFLIDSISHFFLDFCSQFHQCVYPYHLSFL